MGHDHAHHHPQLSSQLIQRSFAVGVTLNIIFVAVEASFGLWSDSLASVSRCRPQCQ